MAEHRTSRWRRLRDSIAIDSGHFAAGSALIDTLGLLAFEAEKLAVRRQPERRRGAANHLPSAAPSPVAVSPGDAPGVCPGSTRANERERQRMTQTAPSEIMPLPQEGLARLIDIGDALELLARAVNQGSEGYAGSQARLYALNGEPKSVVGHALLLANVDADDLEVMRGQRVRDLYREARLPVDLTLGALIVLDAAQRSEDLGACGDEVLDDATAAAARFLDLISVVPEVTQHLDRCSGRCDLVPSQPSDLRP
jgi:hypothetical protein